MLKLTILKWCGKRQESKSMQICGPKGRSTLADPRKSKHIPTNKKNSSVLAAQGAAIKSTCNPWAAGAFFHASVQAEDGLFIYVEPPSRGTAAVRGWHKFLSPTLHPMAVKFFFHLQHQLLYENVENVFTVTNSFNNSRMGAQEHILGGDGLTSHLHLFANLDMWVLKACCQHVILPGFANQGVCKLMLAKAFQMVCKNLPQTQMRVGTMQVASTTCPRIVTMQANMTFVHFVFLFSWIAREIKLEAFHLLS